MPTIRIDSMLMQPKRHERIQLGRRRIDSDVRNQGVDRIDEKLGAEVPSFDTHRTTHMTCAAPLLMSESAKPGNFIQSNQPLLLIPNSPHQPQVAFNRRNLAISSARFQNPFFRSISPSVDYPSNLITNVCPQCGTHLQLTDSGVWPPWCRSCGADLKIDRDAIRENS